MIKKDVMSSKPIYYEQPYAKSLEATVVALTDQGVVLDKTICYPEGGGQSGDRGTIGGCLLLDTHKDEEKVIYHMVKEPTFSVGDTVLIELDWDHRYHYMQMHTAQHVASGLLFSHFGIKTVSVHQGEKRLTIETDQEAIDERTCYELEDLVNKKAREHHPVHYEVHSHEEAEHLGLRRSIKVEDAHIRLVVVDSVDTVACGGLHVANTAEIVLFQYVGQEKLRGHVRLIFAVGDEALAEIRENRNLVSRLCSLHSAQRHVLLEVEEQNLIQSALDRTQLQKKSLQLVSCLLKEKVEKASVFKGVPVVLWNIEDDMDMKQLGTAFTEYEDLALCATKQEKGKLLWLVGLAGKASLFFDFAAERNHLLGGIAGKGGGKAPLFQGVGSGVGETLFKSFMELIG